MMWVWLEGLEGDESLNLVTGDSGLPRVVEHVDFLRAIVVGSSFGVVSGDGGIGGYDLRVREV